MKVFIRVFVIAVTIGLALAGGQKLNAQDIHFSMFYASPLNLNPALTGVNDCSYRATGIYRNQLRSVTSPAVYTTYSASFDMKLLQTKLPNDIFGIGAMFVGDKSGDAKITMNSAMISAAFHKGLDKGHRHFLGLGVQLGYTMKSLKWQQIAFPTQFNGTDFDLSQSNGENLSNPKGYFDMQAGLLHQSSFNDRFAMMTGFTVYHLVQPKESFLGDKNVKLPMRFTVHEGLRIMAVKNFYITPNFIFQYQNKAMEINFGTAFEYHIQAPKTKVVPSIGAWYRATGSDAAILTAGLEAFNTRLQFAYDISTSSLKKSSGGRGGFELAIIFQGCFKTKSLNVPILVPCPMM